MTGMAVDGLISGLQTSDLITKMMDIERAPQQLLQNQQTVLQKAVSAFQSLNTKFSALATAAKTITGDILTPSTSWKAVTATSSDATRVAVSAQSGAAASSLTFTVNALATAATSFSTGTTAATTDVVTNASSLKLTKNGVNTTIALTTGSLQDVVNAVNGANAGVTAAAVQVAPGAYKLQLTSTTTGADDGLGIALTRNGGGAPTWNAGSLGGLTTNAGSDAQLYVGPAGSGYTVTRTSNTISDLIPGATLTLLKADPTASTSVTLAADPNAAADAVSKMVDAVNSIFGQIKLDSSYNTTTKVGGAFTGDPLTRSLQQQLASATTNSVAGNALGSPGLAGVSITRDGTLTFDKTKFLAAYAKDPASVQAVLGAGTAASPGVAGRLAALAKSATDTGTGSVTLAISNRQSRVSALGTQIDAWDTRLALKQKTLQSQFTAMETALGTMKSQSNWLAGQIAGLSSG
jgi:flagellar hook-associated protein 2